MSDFLARSLIPLAWLLIAACAVLVLLLARLHWTGSPPGDRGVGWAFLLLLGNGALAAGLVLLAVLLAGAGRVPTWASGGGAVLFVLAAGSISAMGSFALPTGSAPRDASALLRLAPLIGPTLLLVAAAWSLRAPPNDVWVERLLALVALHALIGLLLIAAPSLLQLAESWRLAWAPPAERLGRFEQGQLEQIERSQPDRDWPMLLSHYREGTRPALRAAAAARLAEWPDWQAHALAGLDGPEVEAVLIWLSAEMPESAADFAARLPLAIHRVADQVRERIRRANHPSNLYEGLMSDEVERVLKVVHRLRAHRVDQDPALRALRAAFEEPSPYPHPRYRAVAAIERRLR